MTTTAGTSPTPSGAALAPLIPTPETGRVQLALNVDDLTEAVTFYTALFGTGPAKLRPGYANFSLATPPLKLVLLENPGKGGTLNHLGVEVASTETVHSEIARLSGAGLFTDEEMGTTCCFATQDKVWVTGPGGERWEVYTVLADSQTFGTSPQTLIDAGQVPDASSGVCCGTTGTGEATTGAAGDTPASCC
jgi:catechol 2,3-dioxygenase-like lactoylglutathione lyase family enzyme